mmetsp:Transcript_37705/g.104151  ORF Transcript_37705/g.104151 Transcript_37705/m.104151 type:complete len:221 (-) Transcript_37705:1544-2206(-)
MLAAQRARSLAPSAPLVAEIPSTHSTPHASCRPSRLSHTTTPTRPIHNRPIAQRITDGTSRTPAAPSHRSTHGIEGNLHPLAAAPPRLPAVTRVRIQAAAPIRRLGGGVCAAAPRRASLHRHPLLSPYHHTRAWLMCQRDGTTNAARSPSKNPCSPNQARPRPTHAAPHRRSRQTSPIPHVPKQNRPPAPPRAARPHPIERAVAASPRLTFAVRAAPSRP